MFSIVKQLRTEQEDFKHDYFIHKCRIQNLSPEPNDIFKAKSNKVTINHLHNNYLKFTVKPLYGLRNLKIYHVSYEVLISKESKITYHNEKAGYLL